MLAHLPWIWNWSAAGWAAVAAWGTLVIAGVAARYAYRQVVELAETRAEQAQPFVVVDVESHAADFQDLDLVVKNVGTTVAYDVRLAFRPQLRSTSYEFAERDIASANLVRHGIPSMPPGREHRMHLDNQIQLQKSDLPRSYEVTVSFDDFRGRRHDLPYRLDLEVQIGRLVAPVRSLHDAATALVAIERTLQRWTDGIDGLRVWNYDGRERDRRQFEGMRMDTENEPPPADDAEADL